MAVDPIVLRDASELELSRSFEQHCRSSFARDRELISCMNWLNDPRGWPSIYRAIRRQIATYPTHPTSVLQATLVSFNHSINDTKQSEEEQEDDTAIAARTMIDLDRICSIPPRYSDDTSMDWCLNDLDPMQDSSSDASDIENSNDTTTAPTSSRRLSSIFRVAHAHGLGSMVYTDHEVVLDLFDRHDVASVRYYEADDTRVVDQLVAAIEAASLPAISFIHLDLVDEAGHHGGIYTRRSSMQSTPIHSNRTESN